MRIRIIIGLFPLILVSYENLYFFIKTCFGGICAPQKLMAQKQFKEGTLLCLSANQIGKYYILEHHERHHERHNERHNVTTLALKQASPENVKLSWYKIMLAYLLDLHNISNSTS